MTSLGHQQVCCCKLPPLEGSHTFLALSLGGCPCQHAFKQPLQLQQQGWTLFTANLPPCRTKDNPYVNGQVENVRFFASAPLISSDGHRFGCL